jgi:Calcineurin-like phosphoesterase
MVHLIARKIAVPSATWISIALLASSCGGGSSSTSTAEPVPQALAAPTLLGALAGDHSVLLNFSLPASQSGRTDLNYQATCAATDGTVYSTYGSQSPLTISGLTNGIPYNCSVATVAASGTPISSASTIATPLGAATQTGGAFVGSIVLGSPTAKSIVVNAYSASQSGQVSVSYGTSTGTYSKSTGYADLSAGKPIEIPVDGLSPNTRYYYRLLYRDRAGNPSSASDEFSFQTARPAGSSFTFSIQGDSHPERVKTQFDAELYTRTLMTVASDRPDFYILMGDDFSVDTLDPATINAAQVTERYTLQKPYLTLIGRSAPLFLVNGNHEQAAKYLLDGTPNNVAVWAQNARNAHYAQPAPDGFYTGNNESVPFIGLLRNYFSWTWGDALFVVIDPYWSSPVAVDNTFGNATKRSNLWDVTHGDAQYQWLKSTLEQSKAKYKFVFAHHVMGTGRGGVEVAKLWEWGGENQAGVSEFLARRPAWSKPIHKLMADNNVTIFFQGHDHIWVKQSLDGVTYQTLSQPADPNYSLFNADAYLTGDKMPNSGYTRVNVSPTGVKVEYVRTYLAKDEGPTQVHGAVAKSYTVQ